MSVISVFITLAIIGTLIMFLAGSVSMAHGGQFDREHEVEFMWGRVVMQAIAVGLIFIAMLFWA